MKTIKSFAIALFVFLNALSVPAQEQKGTILYFTFATTSDPATEAQELLINVQNTYTGKRKLFHVKEGQSFYGFVIGQFQKKIVRRTNPNTGFEEEVDLSYLPLQSAAAKEATNLVFNTPTQIEVFDQDLLKAVDSGPSPR